MPTNDEGNGLGPTATDVNASQIDVTALPVEELEKHPHVQELKKKYSAAHQDMDKTNLSRKELLAENARLKVLAGETDEKEKEEPVAPQFVTKEELWEVAHSKDIELYGDDEFKGDVKNGIPRDYALKNAKLRFQSNPDRARLERQQTMASGPAAGTRNIESEDLDGFNAEEAAKWGYTKESWLRQRELKKGRNQSI